MIIGLRSCLPLQKILKIPCRVPHADIVLEGALADLIYLG